MRRRGSLLAAQCDAQFTPRWSATVQLRLAPSVQHDCRWDLRPNCAFVAWRPDNPWLLRVGRLRGPLYLYAESIDIGLASDMARLPAEVYSLSQTTDLDGAAVSTTWPLGSGAVTRSGYRRLTDSPLQDGSQAAALVKATPGAVGCVDSRDLVPGLNMVLRP